MIVIADDITGAAEIAGIAHSHRLETRLLCGTRIDCANDTADMVSVVATDTRSMTEEDAVSTTRRIAASLAAQGTLPPIFKKTDSALRGHVTGELTALMEGTKYQRAVYVPANPSKNRIVRNGIYYVDGTPIHETDFSFDPEFPAVTSLLRERFADAQANHIHMPDAETQQDLSRIVGQYNDGKTIFAGAADLFTEYISGLGRSRNTYNDESIRSGMTAQDILIVCGSTQSKPLDIGIPTSPMPRDIYDGADDISQWDTKDYERTRRLILTIPYTHRTGKNVATHLRKATAKMVKSLTAGHCPKQLVIEGGATAWATLQALGWTRFDIERQIAPGVVQMRAQNGVLITLKPGSYPWGAYFFHKNS